LLRRREIKKIAIVACSTRQGVLCGGLNHQSDRKNRQFLIVIQKVPVTMVSVGRKGIDFSCGGTTGNTCGIYRLGDRPTLLDTARDITHHHRRLTNGLVDEV